MKQQASGANAAIRVARQREARRELLASAAALHTCQSFERWRDVAAPQWALDALSQREVDALFGMFWEPRAEDSPRLFS